jgi:hypothetical protein
MISKTIQYKAKVEKNRLFCQLNQSMSELFFSLVDYRNNYFTSDDPTKIIEFYDGFDNRNQLIKWMQERPKGIANIHEVDGDKDIIVVIPTADFNGKYAKECRDNIFKGLHIVFVESGGRGDFYFNFAHNCNVGIKRAMEYNPKWIVVSNDDMYKIDDVETLRSELVHLSQRNVSSPKSKDRDIDAVYTLHPEYGNSAPVQLTVPNILWKMVALVLPHSDFVLAQKLLNKFNTKLKWSKVKSIFYKRGYMFINFGSFFIFSGSFVAENGGKMFDEVYINGVEDVDISINVKVRASTATTNYRISAWSKEHPVGGATLGTGTPRKINVASFIYLVYKIDDGWLELKNDPIIRKFLLK